jgi:hypothetical protein
MRQTQSCLQNGLIQVLGHRVQGQGYFLLKGALHLLSEKGSCLPERSRDRKAMDSFITLQSRDLA